MKDKMNLAYLTTQYPAVSHSFIRREIAGLEAAGCQVSRFSVRAPVADLPDPRDKAEVAKTRVILKQGMGALCGAFILTALIHPVATVRALACALAMYRKAGKGLIKHLAYYIEAAWLARCLIREGISHLHVHFGTNPTAVARIARKLGGPSYSFTVHGPDEFDNPIGLDLRGKIADASQCVAISSFGRSQLMRWSDYRDWGKIAVVRCGVDESFIDAAQVAPAADTHILCCVARLSGQKGLPLLLDAAAVLKTRTIDFRLILVGDGEMRDEVERQIERDGLRHHVTITGWASSAEVRAHILSSRAMVLPSFAEGLPVVIMEALALERPVIASAIAGTPELVDAGCGILVTAGDVTALADAMQRLLETPIADVRAMGAEGRRRVLERHDASVNAHMMMNAIAATRQP